MPDAAAITATVHRYCETFRADRDGWVANFAPGAWIEDPVGTPRRSGAADLAAFWDETHQMSDETSLTPLVVNVAGEEVAFLMQARVVVGDAVFGLQIIDVMTFDDESRITTMKAYWDPATMAPLHD